MRSGILICLFVLVLSSHVRAKDYKTFKDAYQAGNAAFLKADFGNAQAPLEAAMKLARPTDNLSPVLSKLEIIYRKSGNIDGLVTVFAAELEQMPYRELRATKIKFKMQELQRWEHLDSFLAICSKRLERNPTDLVALAALSFDSRSKPESPETLGIQKRFDEADRDLSAKQAEAAEARAKGSPFVVATSLAEAARLWGDAGTVDRLETAAKAALKTAADNPKDLDGFLVGQIEESIGEGYLSVGRVDDAEARFEAAIKANPSELKTKVLRRKIAEAREKAQKPKTTPAN